MENKIKKPDLDKKLQEATIGTYEKVSAYKYASPVKAESCTVRCGYTKTPDGRRAQIQITVEANKDNWI